MSIRYAAATLAILPALSLAGEPGDRIEEIVVTADYRGATLMEVPVSVSVISEEQIAARNAEHLEDVLALAPNVNLSNGASRARFFQIRGIGERGQFAEPLNSSVGLIVDDVDFSGVGSGALMFDVAQVEVLRGPQSTRYGANALAGLINIATRAPTETPEYQLSVEGANYHTWGVSAVASGPIGNRSAYRVGVQQRSSNGFIHNTFRGDDATNDRDEFVARGKLHVDVNDSLGIDTMLAFVDIDNGYDAFSLDNDRNTRSDQPGQDDQRSVLFSTHANYASDAGVQLQAIVGFAHSDVDYGFDEDWTFVGFHPLGFSSTDRYQRDRTMISAELRALSMPATRLFGGTTDWTAGVYVIDTDVDLTRTYTFLPGPFDSAFETLRVAGFGELRTTLTERLHLTTGLRVEHRGADYADSEAVKFSPDENLYGARMALDWAFSDALTAYASVSRGFKAGGFNTDGSLDADLRQFDAETLWSGELGLKGLVLDGRVALRLAAFEMRRDNVQIASSIVRVRDDGSAEFIDFTGNAAEGFNRGVEVEADWFVSDRVSVFAALGLLDTEYKNFVNAAGEDLDGRDQAQAPNYQFHIGTRVNLPYGLVARLEAEGRDGYFFSDSHDARSKSYALMHASLGWQGPRLGVSLFARNLTDENYATRGFFFGNDPRTNYAPATWIQLGEPRRIGIRVDYRAQ